MLGVDKDPPVLTTKDHNNNNNENEQEGKRRVKSARGLSRAALERLSRKRKCLSRVDGNGHKRRRGSRQWMPLHHCLHLKRTLRQVQSVGLVPFFFVLRRRTGAHAQTPCLLPDDAGTTRRKHDTANGCFLDDIKMNEVSFISQERKEQPEPGLEAFRGGEDGAADQRKISRRAGVFFQKKKELHLLTNRPCLAFSRLCLSSWLTLSGRIGLSESLWSMMEIMTGMTAQETAQQQRHEQSWEGTHQSQETRKKDNALVGKRRDKTRLLEWPVVVAVSFLVVATTTTKNNETFLASGKQRQRKSTLCCTSASHE